ncbi:MAG TPA: TraR/DksA family transcriptional regulator [Longimicrobiales bacterium]|nr:TraR/DksA family transcriptional regulator [Longimicrobiales bacterium]
MNDEQRKHVEKRLLEERTRVQRALGQLDDRMAEAGAESDGDLTNYPLHQADEGTDTMEEEKEAMLASQEGRILYAIDRALRRLYKEPEELGRCQECGAAIEPERLDLIPWAEYCMSCQEEREAAGKS